MATVERILPSKPCRNQDALYKTAQPVADGEGLLQAGRRDPNPHRRPKPLHSSWHTSHRGRGISPSGERGNTQGIVALPIHDAVLVRDNNSDKAEAVMKKVFKEHTGITPGVTLA